MDALWGKVPLLGIVDDNLSHFAFRVLALFSVKPLSGDVIELSHSEIAEAMTCSERQAIRVVVELERAKYVEVGRRHNTRNSYRLNVATAGAVASIPAGVVLAVDLKAPSATVKCRRCGKPCRKVGKAGWCRSCVEASELAARVESARAEVGQDATPEQLAAHLKNARLAQRIRRILEKSERAA